MAYEIFKINAQTVAADFVLRGTVDHGGTTECVSFHDVMTNSTTKTVLASYLDFRFLRAHGERLAQAMSARSAETEGLSPQDASAVVVDDAPDPSIASQGKDRNGGEE